MKKLIIPAAAAMSLLVTVAFAPTAARAQHRCDNPSGIADTRACEEAAEGPAALRNFVWRTRMIWGLYYWDYAPRDVQVTSESATVKAASRAAESRQAAVVATSFALDLSHSGTHL